MMSYLRDRDDYACEDIDGVGWRVERGQLRMLRYLEAGLA
jgi:hypothetical protein